MDLQLTQPELAKRLQVDEATILNWERNKTSPGTKHLGRITSFLGYLPLTCTGASGLAAQVLETRQRLGLTQEALAARLRVAPDSVRNWERGRRRPRGRRLRELQECLSRTLGCQANGSKTGMTVPSAGLRQPADSRTALTGG